MTCLVNPEHLSSTYQNEPEYYLNINIPKNEDPIQDVIEREFQGGIRINDWRCQICQSQGGNKQKLIQEGLMPGYILIKIRRTERNQYGRLHELNTPIIPPLGFTIQTEQDRTYAYSLCGVLTHIGNNLSSGHYISEVRRDTQWWR